MRKQNRLSLSAAERAELWTRWRRGESLKEISRGLARAPTVVRMAVVRTGGFPEPVRVRNARVLSLPERESISRGIAVGHTAAQIAVQIGRSPSTVGREISRNGGRTCYRAAEADSRAWGQAVRPKVCKLASNLRLRDLVAQKLSLDWSPEQIAGWIRLSFTADDRMQISHETIYRSLFIQARGVLRRELIDHLRSRRTVRRSRKATIVGQHRGQIVDAVSIRERPAEADDRAVPGHWEGDLIVGTHSSCVATLVERHSRFTMLVRLQDKGAAGLATALSRQIGKLPSELRRSLTWDRGLEMAQHAAFTVATDVNVYFCDPKSPWQRGTNENTNRLLRQYFPKGTDLSGHSQEDLDQVALQLNQRPRKTLGFETPAQRLGVRLQ